MGIPYTGELDILHDLKVCEIHYANYHKHYESLSQAYSHAA